MCVCESVYVSVCVVVPHLSACVLLPKDSVVFPQIVIDLCCVCSSVVVLLSLRATGG